MLDAAKAVVAMGTTVQGNTPMDGLEIVVMAEEKAQLGELPFDGSILCHQRSQQSQVQSLCDTFAARILNEYKICGICCT